MSTETAAPVAPAAPAMQRAITPPVSGFDHPENARESSRMERVRKAIAPQPEPVAPAATPPPAEVAPAAAPEATPAVIKKDAPAPAPVEAPDPVDSMKLPANANPESVTNFANLAKVAKERKTLADTATREAADLRKQIEQLRAQSPTASGDSPEIVALKAEHKSVLDRLMVLDLQNHPDFTKQYVEPKKQALAQAGEVLQYNGKEGVELAPLLGKPLKDFNAAVSEFTKDMNSADAMTVASSLRQARELHGKEQQALSKSGELHQQLQLKAQQQQKQAFEAVAGEIVPNFTKREITDAMSAEERTEADAYNQSVETLRARAETIAFGQLGEREVANLAFKGAAMDHLVTHAVPYLERHVASQNQVIAQLREQLQSMKGGKAPASISNSNSAPSSPGKTTVDQRVAAALHGTGRA